MSNPQIDTYQNGLKKRELFLRHQKLVTGAKTSAVEEEQRDGKTAEVNENNYNAFFIPRLNYFLGGYLRYGGVYPDGVIRLFRHGKAHLPCKDVHELMEVTGRTGWLGNPLIHKDSPTFKRYLERNSRYIDHLAREIQAQNSNSSQAIHFVVIKPLVTFFSMLIRHKGILDGWRGVVFAFFSSIRFARAYWRFTRLS